jgi:hypothetical protein
VSNSKEKFLFNPEFSNKNKLILKKIERIYYLITKVEQTSKFQWNEKKIEKR